MSTAKWLAVAALPPLPTTIILPDENTNIEVGLQSGSILLLCFNIFSQKGNIFGLSVENNCNAIFFT